VHSRKKVEIEFQSKNLIRNICEEAVQVKDTQADFKPELVLRPESGFRLLSSNFWKLFVLLSKTFVAMVQLRMYQPIISAENIKLDSRGLVVQSAKAPLEGSFLRIARAQ